LSAFVENHVTIIPLAAAQLYSLNLPGISNTGDMLTSVVCRTLASFSVQN